MRKTLTTKKDKNRFYSKLLKAGSNDKVVIPADVRKELNLAEYSILELTYCKSEILLKVSEI